MDEDIMIRLNFYIEKVDGVPNAYFIQATDKDSLLGEYAESIADTIFFYKGKVGRIDRIKVADSKQGSGVGKQMVSYIERYMNKHGVKEIYLEPLDKKAENFWKHMGYKQLKDKNMIKKL